MIKRDSTAAALTNVDADDVIRVVERIVHGDASLPQGRGSPRPVVRRPPGQG